MKVFGPSAWGPATGPDPVKMTITPVGEPCLRCREPVVAGDYGVVMPYLGEDGPREVAEHRECFLRQVFGSVGHQMKKCSCHGGTEEDPAGMTKREAAQAAVALFNLLNNRG